MFQHFQRNRMKRQPKEWDRVLAGHVSTREIILKMYKELKHFHSRKINNQVKNSQKSLRR